MSSVTELPRVFLGSASENLGTLEEVGNQLQTCASVVLWNDRSMRVPNEYFLETLRRMAPTFDFAVFHFGGVDRVKFRSKTLDAPRDNVIFEAGLFMATLGRKRTLVIWPRVVDRPLKILTDLAGLDLIPFEVPKSKVKQRDALQACCLEVVNHIRKLGPRPRPVKVAVRGPRDVSEAGEVLKALIIRDLQKEGRAIIQNIALDMDITWPVLKDRLLGNSAIENVKWQSLMIDPDSSAVQKLESDTVSTKSARVHSAEIQDMCEGKKLELRNRKVDFECRCYQDVPILHGFLVGRSDLLVSICGIADDKLIGKPNPYWRLTRADIGDVRDHFFDVFEQWFDHQWRTGKKVWPAEERSLDTAS